MKAFYILILFLLTINSDEFVASGASIDTSVHVYNDSSDTTQNICFMDNCSSSWCEATKQCINTEFINNKILNCSSGWIDGTKSTQCRFEWIFMLSVFGFIAITITIAYIVIAIKWCHYKFPKYCKCFNFRFPPYREMPTYPDYP